jgi:hypothetical protein
VRVAFSNIVRVIIKTASVASLLAVVTIGVFWRLSYASYISAAWDSHRMAMRFEFIQTHGTAFFKWTEIAQVPGNGWQPTAQVDLDGLWFGFAAYAVPGNITHAGEIAVPHWALLVLAFAAALPLVLLPMRHRRLRDDGFPISRRPNALIDEQHPDARG